MYLFFYLFVILRLPLRGRWDLCYSEIQHSVQW